MTIRKKLYQLATRLTAALIRNDYAEIDRVNAAIDRVYLAIDDLADVSEVVHYDFCTTKYRANADFIGGELVSASPRENAAEAPAWFDETGRSLTRIGGGIRLSWSPDEDAQGTGCSDGTDPEAVGRYARMYGKRRIARDLINYIPDDGSFIPAAILNSTLIEEVD